MDASLAGTDDDREYLHAINDILSGLKNRVRDYTISEILENSRIDLGTVSRINGEVEAVVKRVIEQAIPVGAV